MRNEKGQFVGTHKLSKTAFYRKFRHITERCSDKNNLVYKNYGGRGIRCEWNTFDSFKNDMYQSYLAHKKVFGSGFGTTLERIDNNGNYCKENCKWTTMHEQRRNKRTNHLLNINGETKTVSDWSLCLGIDRRKVFCRLYKGWDAYKALGIIQ